MERKVFEKDFNKKITALGKAEKASKAIIIELSRSLLQTLHLTGDMQGDIGYINRFIAELSPMNKKIAVAYFKEFSGFQEKEGSFTSKDKKHYDNKAEASALFLDDPLNNMFSWAERNIEISKKEFTVGAVTSYMTGALKKASDAGITQEQVLEAVLLAGITPECLMAMVRKFAAPATA